MIISTYPKTMEARLTFYCDWRTIVLVTYCCYSKLPQASWLKTTQIYYCIILEIKNPKIRFMRLISRYWQGCIPSETLRREFFPCLFQFLTSCILWSLIYSKHCHVPNLYFIVTSSLTLLTTTSLFWRLVFTLGCLNNPG